MRRLEGIRPKRGKWQAYVDCPDKQHTKTFPLSTPRAEIEAWRVREALQYGAAQRAPAADSLQARVQAYLTRRRAQQMPTVKQRAAHLELWLQALGRDRSPHSITRAEIDHVLEGWHAEFGRGTVRKRRTALQSFFAWLQGKTGLNPVKGTINPPPPKAEAREIAYPLIERAIAAMPVWRSARPGAPRARSLAPIRCRVIAYVGLPPGILQAVMPDDLSLHARKVRVLGRKKGQGTEPRTVPLSDEGLAAFKAFHEANAYGSFATESLNRAFKRGCKRAGLNPKTVHLYDLRHSFLTQAYRVTRDLATVGRLGLHAEGSVVTERYARGANADVDAAAVAAFSQALAAQRQATLKPVPVQDSVQILPADPARRRKSS
jgi:integrase